MRFLPPTGHALTVIGEGGFVNGNVPEEGMYCAQAVIASASAVVAIMLKVLEEYGRSDLGPSVQALVVQNQFVPIGRDEQRVAQLHRRKEFALGNPLRVRFKE